MPAGVRLAFAPVPVQPPAVRPEWLSHGEWALFQGLRFPKRRRDWLGGRLAAKRAVSQFLGDVPAATIEILPDGARPFVRFNTHPSPVQVSISHAGGWAGAAAFELPLTGPVGLDIEPIQHIEEALFDLAFTTRERAALHGADRTEMALRLWTAKEAVLKAACLGLTVPLQSVSIDLEAGCAALNGEKFLVQTTCAAGYVLSVAFGRKS